MASPFTPITISGYNSDPPANDGSRVEGNQVSWAKHTSKIGDPLKEAIESLSANTQAAFKSIYDQTAEEAAAFVTPSDPTFRAIDTRRYGTGGAAVKSALAVAAIVGGSVYAPAGTYDLTETLSVPSNVTLYGDGDATLFRLNGDFDAFEIDGKSNIVLRDFKIDGQRATYTDTSNDGISLPANGTGFYNITIQRVSITGMAGAGIIALAQLASNAFGLNILQCVIDDCGAHGIVAQDYVNDVNVQWNRVSNYGLLVANRPGITVGRNAKRQRVGFNQVRGSALALGTSVHCISIDQCEDFTVGFNVGDTHIGFGIEMVGVTNGSCVGNTMRDGTRAGIVLVGGASVGTVKKVTVGLNSVIGGAAQGVYLHDGDGTLISDVTLIGNIVDTCSTIAYQVEDSLDVNFVGNEARNCGRSGLWANNTNRVVASGNNLKDNNTTSDAAHAGMKLLNTTSEPDFWIHGNAVTGNNIADYSFNNTVRSADDDVPNPALTFPALDATPDVSIGNTFRTADTTQFTDFTGVVGDHKTIYIISDHAGALSDNANMQPTQVGTKTFTVGRIYALRHVGGVWYELGS